VEAAEQQLTDDSVRAVADAALKQLAHRDLHEATTQPAPPSVEGLCWTVDGCFFSSTGAILALLETLSRRLYWLTAVVGVVGLALGIYLRRFRLLRLIADAWLASAGPLADLVKIPRIGSG